MVYRFRPEVAVEIICGQASTNNIDPNQIRQLVTTVLTQLYQRGIFLAGMEQSEIVQAIQQQLAQQTHGGQPPQAPQPAPVAQPVMQPQQQPMQPAPQQPMQLQAAPVAAAQPAAPNQPGDAPISLTTANRPAAPTFMSP